MKRAVLLLIPLLAACGRGEGNETAEPAVGGSAQQTSREGVQIADLTGLYQALGDGRQRARMCMTPGPSGTTSFGIVTETPGGGSCGGAGEALREGNVLRLTMGGDGECVIGARIEGTQITFPPTLGAGCAYYCGPGATLAGTVFEKTGGTRQDAMRALDLAGDPLCG